MRGWARVGVAAPRDLHDIMVERFQRYERGSGRAPLDFPTTAAFSAAQSSAAQAQGVLAAEWAKISDYAAQHMFKYAAIEGSEYGAESAPSIEQVRDAVATQEYDASGNLISTTPAEGSIWLAGDRYSVYGKAARDASLAVVTADLEAEIKFTIRDLEIQAENQNWDPDALTDAINSAVNNHVAVLDEIAPGKARELRAESAIYGNAVYASYASSYLTRARDRDRATFRSTFEFSLANIEKLIDGISLQFHRQFMVYPESSKAWPHGEEVGSPISNLDDQDIRRDQLRAVGMEFGDANELKITSTYLLLWLRKKQIEATQLGYTPAQIENLGNDFWTAINDAALAKVIEKGVEANDVGSLVDKIMSRDPNAQLPEEVRVVLGLLRPRDRQALEDSLKTLENETHQWRTARYQEIERKRTTDILELEIELVEAIAAGDTEAFKNLRTKMVGLDPKRALALLQINTEGGTLDAPEIVQMIEVDLLGAGAPKFTGADLIGFLDKGQLTFTTFSDYAKKYAVAGDKSWIAAVAEIKSRLQITEILMFADFKTFLDSKQAINLKKVMAAMEAARRLDPLKFNAQNWVHENYEKVLSGEEIKDSSPAAQIEGLKQKIAAQFMVYGITTIEGVKRLLAEAPDDARKKKLEEILDWQAKIDRLEADETD